LRLIVQPLVATILAIRAGVRDARDGQPAFFWTFLTNPGERRNLVRSGWEDVGKVAIIAIALDAIYQVIELKAFYVVQAIIVALTVAVVPYVLLRGAVTSVTRPFLAKASSTSRTTRVWNEDEQKDSAASGHRTRRTSGKTESETVEIEAMTQPSEEQREAGPWGEALDLLRTWDPAWADACLRMSANPWHSGVLPLKLVELIGVAINAACTSLNAEGTRRHIRKALDAGATRDEILFVLKCASVMAIHSCSLGAPILLEEAKSAEIELKPAAAVVTPACDRMKAVGQWNAAWDPFLQLDPAWTDAFMDTGVEIYSSGILPAKDVELLSIAFDASYTHMYAPGTRRHIRNALKVGATMEEVFEVLKLCVAHGVQACNLGVPILAEELAGRQMTEDSPPEQELRSDAP